MNRMKLIIVSLIFVVLSLILLPLISNAEDKTRTKPPTEVEFKLRKEMMTFVPYRDLDRLLDKNKKLVYMSYEELKKLIASKSKIRPLAPVNYVIKDLALFGQAHKDYISFDATYKIQILNKEWVYVPIMSSQVGLKSATLDNKPAPISLDGSNIRILSDAVGEHILKLKYDVKITESGNTKSFKFDMPTLPITRLTIKVPEAYAKLNIANASGQRMEVKDNSTITYANLIGQGSVGVDWKSSQIKLVQKGKPKPKAAEDTRPSKVVADVQTLISIDEGIIQGFTTYNCQIYHKPVEKLNISIPDDIEIISVTSPNNIVQKGPPNISNPNGTEPGKILTVYFNSKIKDNAMFNVAYEKTFENKPIRQNIPDLSLVGPEINKVIGFIAIQGFGNLEIKQLNINNITPVDVTDIPQSLESSAEKPILLAYSYIKDKYTLQLDLIPHKDAPVQVAIIDKANIQSVLSSDGVLTVQADYYVRNMSNDYFKFLLPKNAEILVGTINGQPVHVQKGSNDDKDLPGDITNLDIQPYLINIKNYQNEQTFTVSIMYKHDYKFNFFNRWFNFYKLKSPFVYNVETLTLLWKAWIPGNMDYWTVTDLIKGYRDYSSSISQQTWTNGYSRNEEQPAAQVMSNTMQANDMPTAGEAGSKAVGLLPPEYNLPPTTGLVNEVFSDYLLPPESPSITFIAMPGIINLIIILIMIIITWKIAKNVHNKIKETTIPAEIGKFILPIIIILYIAGLLIGEGIIWTSVILGTIIYLVVLAYKKYIYKSKAI